MSRSRLLVAVSSPWAGEKLARPVVDLATRLEARVTVAHVAVVRSEDEHVDQAAKRGEGALAALAVALEAEGIEAERIMLFGDDVAKAILHAANEAACTLVVAGCTARGPIRRWIVGDVPTFLVRQAAVPVLLLPTAWDGRV